MSAALPLISASFLAGIALGGYFDPAWRWPLLLALLFGGSAVFCYRAQQNRTASLLIAAVFACLGAGHFALARQAVHGSLAPFRGREVAAVGYVQSYDNKAGVFLLRVEEIAPAGSEPQPVKALVRVKVIDAVPLSLAYGRRLAVRGNLNEPLGRRNPGGFDYGAHLETAGAGAMMTVRSRQMQVLPGRGGSALLRLAEQARGRVLQGLQAHLPASEAGLAAGLLLGGGSYVGDDLTVAFRRLGIAHLLAVSGLHTGFVAAFAFFLAGRLRRGVPGLIIVMVMLAGYVFLTGGRPSVWRAALMFGLAYLGRYLGREADARASVAAAALALAAFRPHWVFELSFQLSFLVTAGLLLLVPRFMSFLTPLGRLASPAAVVLAAQAAVLPLQVSHFGLLPLLALPANLLCVPLVGLFMSLGLAGMLLSFTWQPLAAPFYLAALPILTVLERLPRLMAGLPFASLPLNPPGEVWLAYLAALALFIAAPRVRWSRLKVVIAVLICLNLLCLGSLAGELRAPRSEISFLDVGQGLSVFIRTPGGRAVLVDAGPADTGFDSGERIVLPFLRQRRVRSLDLLILTHPHSDHYGGMRALAEQVPVRLFASSGQSEESAAFGRLLATLESRNVQAVELQAGDRLLLDRRTTVTVLSPPEEKFWGTSDDVNNNSLVLLFDLDGFGILITGDAEKEALGRLAGAGELPAAAVLQVPHHGSRSAMPEDFLKALDARVAVIPVGKNPFGHPHPETLSLLQAHVPAVFRTDLHGAVTFYNSGGSWRVRTQVVRNNRE